MKHTFLLLTIILFSVISGGIWAYWVLHYSHNISSQNVDIQAKHIPWDKSSQENTPELTMQSLENIINTTVQNIAPSVVSIIIKKDLVIYRSDPWWFFQEPAGTVSRQVWGGSWFFIKEDGTIITNKHVVSDTNAQYTVILNTGEEYDAQVIALDPVNDLAIIKITDTQNLFTPLALIEDVESVDVWDFALAVWNALAEFQNSVSLGIISGKNRSIEAGWDSLSGLLQTDAAINPGNSWWPLVNLDGNVIGINTAIASNSNGIGFAFGVTKNRIDYMLRSIETDGRIMRPFIGINYIANSPGVARELWLAKDYGVYIVDEAESVVPWSSAQLAGLEPWDIILEVTGKKLGSINDLSFIIQNSLPGDILQLKVLKKNWEEKNIALELWSI